jgi:pimeloyl-ACP methyl ester carboxylesterase
MAASGEVVGLKGRGSDPDGGDPGPTGGLGRCCGCWSWPRWRPWPACSPCSGWRPCRPGRRCSLAPAPVAGQRFWELPTGSRIAWVHLAARGRPKPTPVVFLHGGPGIADMAGDAAYFGQLTSDGYDVYVYDQVGTGRSSRLADPRRYTIAREVADLEAIRGRIGAARMVLIGHSWGGQVAAAYLAAHPANVARVVFSSPGALAPALDDGSGGGVRSRLTLAQQLRLYRLLVRPRVLLGYGLLQLNPLATPVLVIKGSCDYLSWSSGLAYRKALAGARLVYLDHAGHNLYQDRPAAYLAVVRAFLAGRPLPVPAWTTEGVPAGYQGPP